MKIALVVGHDSVSRGAYGNEGVSEWDFNSNLVHSMATMKMFPEEHEIFVFYRSADINGYTNQIIDLHKRIDKLGCEVSIELHFNSFSSNKAQGHEVLYCSQSGKQVAEIMNDALDEHLPTSNRGVKKVDMRDNGGGFCCRGASYAIILEPYFGAHQSDFIYGGKLRMSLMKAIQQGLKGL